MLGSAHIPIGRGYDKYGCPGGVSAPPRLRAEAY